MTTWDQALDDWEAFLDRLDAAFSAGSWESLADLPPWQPPADLAQPPAEPHQARHAALAARAATLQQRLAELLAETASDIAAGRRKHDAGQRYRGR